MAVDKIRPIAVVPYVVVHVQYGKFQKIISMSALRGIKTRMRLQTTLTSTRDFEVDFASY